MKDTKLETHVAESPPRERSARRQGSAPPAGPAAEPASPGAVLRLQREYGNRFVQRVLDLAREGEGAITPDTEKAIESSRHGGRSLDAGVRRRMEGAFGVDLGGVRIHTGAASDALNRRLSARAFTTGSDVFFRHGQYDPGSSAGRELLAHELTHVVQQTGGQTGTAQAKLTLGRPGDRFEQEADQVAREVAATEAIQRQEMDEEDETES